MAFKKEIGTGRKSPGRPPAKSKTVKKDSPFQQFFKPEKSSEKEAEPKTRSRSRAGNDDDKPQPRKTSGTSSNPFSKSKTFTQKFDAESEDTKRPRASRGQGDRNEARPGNFSSDRPVRARSADGRFSSDKPARSGRDDNRFSDDRPRRDDNRFSSDKPARFGRDDNRFSDDRPRRDDNRFSADRPRSADGRFSSDKPARFGRDDNRLSDDRPRRDDDQNVGREDEERPTRSKKLFDDDFFQKDKGREDSRPSRFSKDGDKDRKSYGDKGGFGKKTYDNKSDDRRRDDRPAYDRPSFDQKRSDDRPTFDKSDRFDNRFSDNKSSDRNSRSGSYGDKSYGDKYPKPYSEKKTSKSKEGDEEMITRLNKFVAQSGLCSRRKAVELIKAGEVWVNGKQELNPAYEMQETDEVTHKSIVLKKEEKLLYLLMNKPKNVITTSEDEKGRKTVLDLVAGRYDERVYPVGRLDRNTSGLLLLTNDGELAKKLAHPSHMVKKFYQVELDKNLKTSDIDKIKDGLNLEDGIAEVDAIDYIEGGKKNEVGIEIHIGKNRIVRRIFESLGYEVVKLDRTYYGGLTKKDLPRGFIRELTPQEVIMLKHFTNNRKKE